MIGLSLGIMSMLRSSFSPISLFAASESGVWYDPSDLTTLFTDVAGTTPVTTAGQTVALMLDKSGNGLHATQATAAARPAYQTDGTYHWLAFDGVDDFLATPTITPGIDKAQLFAGVRRETTGNIQAIWGTAGTATEGSMRVYLRFNSDTEIGSYTKGTGTGASVIVNPYAMLTKYVIEQSFDLAGATGSDILPVTRINGAPGANATTPLNTPGGSYTPQVFYVGSVGTSFFMKCNLYSLITRFGSNLTTPVIGNVETYVNSKTGAY